MAGWLAEVGTLTKAVIFVGSGVALSGVAFLLYRYLHREESDSEEEGSGSGGRVSIHGQKIDRWIPMAMSMPMQCKTIDIGISLADLGIDMHITPMRSVTLNVLSFDCTVVFKHHSFALFLLQKYVQLMGGNYLTPLALTALFY